MAFEEAGRCRASTLRRPEVALQLLIAGFSLVAFGCGSEPIPAVEIRAPKGLERVSEEVASARQLHSHDPVALATRLTELARPIAEQQSDRYQLEWAARILEEALELRRKYSPGELSVAELSHLLSDLDWSQSRWDDCVRHELEALSIFTSKGSEVLQQSFEARHGAGQCLHKLGKYVEAEKMMRDSTKAERKAVGPLQAAILAADIAEAIRSQGRFSEAERAFVAALNDAERSAGPNDSSKIVGILNNLAGLYRDQSRWADSLLLLERARQLLGPNADARELEQNTFNRAEVQRFIGRRHAAELLYQQALQIGAQDEHLGPKRWEVGLMRCQFAELLEELERLEEAEDQYRGGLAVMTAAGGENQISLAYPMQNLARLLALTGRPDDSDRLFARALELNERFLGKQHPDAGLTLAIWAGASQRGDPAAARLRADRAIAILSHSPANGKAMADVLSIRAELRWDAGERSLAIEDLALAIEHAEKLRGQVGGSAETRAGYFSAYSRFFTRMVSFQLKEGSIPTAFAYSERGKSQALLDQLQAVAVLDSPSHGSGTNNALAARERQARERLGGIRKSLALLKGSADLTPEEYQARAGALTADLQAAELEHQQARELVEASNPAFRGVGAARELPGLALLQRDLVPSRGWLLSYVIGVDTSHLIALPALGATPLAYELTITPDLAAQLGVKPGPMTASSLAAAVSAARAEIGVLDAAVDGEARGQLVVPSGVNATDRPTRSHNAERMLQALWQVLIPSEMWPKLTASPEIVVLPDGAMHRLPLEVLVVSRASAKQGTEYWIDTGPAIRYGPSATVLLALSRQDAQDNRSKRDHTKVVSLSDPIYRGEGTAATELRRLPGTARETQAIVAAFGGRAPSGPVVVLDRRRATEPLLRAALPESRIIHLATHGLVSENEQGLAAELALTAPAQPTDDLSADGRLELREIYDLSLDADLTVLSACDTSTGSIVDGEGVFALARGFLTAGSARIVASHWPVDDDCTARLIGSFFRRLRTGTRYTLALADATRELRATPACSEPRQWGGFMLSGLP